jgi:endonuclease/exonuclease/phosphatase family metal-dependent hydrolase
MAAKRRITRIVLRLVAVIVAGVLTTVGLFLAWCTATEFRPQESEPVRVNRAPAGSEVFIPGPDKPLTLVTFNIGSAGLGQDQDFFMDGGDMVHPPADAVDANMAGILATVWANPADAYLFQEVDTGSKRSYGRDQAAELREDQPLNSALAYNFRSTFTPYPWPPIGGVNSGLLTLTNMRAQGATRQSLPVPFDWPVRLFNFKRCLLAERIRTADAHELVIVNVHMEAYSDDAARAEQTRVLMDLLEAEYAAGNYVIAGGDFNQTFPGVQYSLINDHWQPGTFPEDMLPEGWTYANDPTSPTARLNDRPWDGTNQLFGVDGFIVSPNVTVSEVTTLDLGFEHSDHNPVRLVAHLGAG